MDPLIALAALLPVAVLQQPAADPVGRWEAPVAEAAARFGIPADWIRRVMRAESGGRTTLNGRPITSPKGAMGLMQVMPATYAEMARRHALGADPYDPRDNIMAGAAYLRLMYDRFGYPGLFGAYNAGPARYAAWLRTGRGLPAETRTYLALVGGSPKTGDEVTAARAVEPARAGLFFSLRVAPTSEQSGTAVAPNSYEIAPGQPRDAHPTTLLFPAERSMFVPLRQPESRLK